MKMPTATKVPAKPKATAMKNAIIA
jgi:hypothetical protein